MNYEELKQQVLDGLENSGEAAFVDNLDAMIRRAEERIFYLLQLPDFRRNFNGVLNTGSPYLFKPPGYKFVYSLRVTSPTSHFLTSKDANYIREVYPDTTYQKMPEHYAEFDGYTFLIGPTPDQDYPVEINFGGLPVSIVDSETGTTWMGDNAENTLLYGTLLEGANFLQYAPEEIAELKEHFDVDVGRLKNLGEAHNRRDAYRDGQRRQQVT